MRISITAEFISFRDNNFLSHFYYRSVVKLTDKFLSFMLSQLTTKVKILFLSLTKDIVIFYVL